MGTSFVAPASRSKIANQIYKFKLGGQTLESRSQDETYKGTLVCAIKVRKELVNAGLRDEVVFRESKALRIECPGLNHKSKGSIFKFALLIR